MSIPPATAGTDYYVYMLRCADLSLYVGMSGDLAKRVAAHDRGDGAAYTASRTPVALIWSQRCATSGEAMRIERRLKSYTRDRKIKLAATCDVIVL